MDDFRHSQMVKMKKEGEPAFDPLGG